MLFLISYKYSHQQRTYFCRSYCPNTEGRIYHLWKLINVEYTNAFMILEK